MFRVEVINFRNTNGPTYARDFLHISTKISRASPGVRIGAGKSILLDALDALLGGAQGALGVRLLRNRCDRARIEASFAMNAGLKDWMEQAGLEVEDDDLGEDREVDEGSKRGEHGWRH